MDKLIIIDGNSLANRAFYGVPLLTNSKGVYTNAVYGFINMMLGFFKKQEPMYAAVAFDVSKKVFRHEKYADYKGTRKGMPEELAEQMPILKEILRSMNIAILEKEGYEADDIIGTVVKKAEENNIASIILTGDKDSLQLISELTEVYLTKKGISQTQKMDLAALAEEYGLNPAQICDLKGLMGDSSDNIPGVVGVGEKTALKLLREYHDVENLYAHAEELGGKLGEKIRAGRESAYMSKELATIHCAVPIEFAWEDLLLKSPEREKLVTLYKELELNNLLKALQAEESQQKKEISGEYLFDSKALADILVKTEINKLGIAFTENSKERTAKIGLYLNDKAYAMDIAALDEVIELLSGYLEDEATAIFCDDAKKLYNVRYKYGIEVNNLLYDSELAGYLLEPEKEHTALKQAEDYLNIEIAENDEGYIFALMEALALLSEIVPQKLAEQELDKLYYELELPLAKVLVRMEHNGVKINREYLNNLNAELTERIAKITDKIYTEAGEEFNLNSPKQLGVILFEKLGMPVIKKTKTGYSTSAEVLEQLKDYAIVENILAYRQLAKLKSTYVEGLLNLADENDAIHTSFNQTITATGRLSSTEPNLQNIPVKTEEGRRIREAFIAKKKGNLLLACDYSQIELRVLAHVSGDEVLKNSFINAEDIHARTASEVFGVPMSEVTREQRRNAKAVNFGIIYGQSDFGLANELGISRKEAKEYIDNYFARYHTVKDWITGTIEETKKTGFVTTLAHRRRYIRDINSKNFNLRSFAERTAVNTPIQGSAADIIKIAMLDIDKKLREEKLRSQMILQIHDELVFEMTPEEAPHLIALVKKSMENAVKLDVPLAVDVKVGFNLAQMDKA